MRTPRAWSLRSKLTALLFVGLLVPLGTAVGVVATRDVRSFRQDLTSSTALAAAVVAEYSASDLAFHDAREAQKTLAWLTSLPGVEFAVLYDTQGQLFAAVQHPGVPVEQVAPALLRTRERWMHLDGGHLDVLQPVTYEGTRYGTLHLRTSTAELRARIHTYLLGVLGVALGVTALSLGLAFLLQRLLTRRVLALAEVAQEVAQKGDTSVRAQKDADDELGFLADAFNSMLAEVERRQKEAQEAIRVRDDFLSVASHELRTPLTPLKLKLLTLQRQAERGELTDDGRGHVLRDLEVSARQVRRLEALVGNLLDVTRIAHGKLYLQPEEMDLSALVQEVAERMREELAAARTPLTVKTPSPVVGRWDRLKLDQVVTNLLTNALKYGAGKPIEVEVEQAAGTARLRVTDHGVGIAAQDRERIFAQFERAAPVRHYGGLGLGLFITRNLVSSHGGHIHVESEPGVRTTFTVELPLEGPPEETPPGEAQAR